MGMTLAQKVFSRVAGRPVKVGQIVTVRPDRAMSHDNTAAIARKFKTLGVDQVKYPDMHVIVLDHAVPAPNVDHAINHKEIREFVAAQGIKNFFDAGTGICHQVMVEKGLVGPGMLAVGSDSHSTSYGSVGALGVAIGRSEMAVIMATGQMWFRVPQTMKVVLTGEFQPRFNQMVSAKDLALHILGLIRADGATYMAVEFHGEAVKKLSIADRFTIANMCAEMGAKAGVFPRDKVTDAYIAESGARSFDALPDPDADYAITREISLSEVQPMVAMPHTVDNVAPATEVRGVKVNQALLGTCTNGRLQDLAAAAAILKGKKIHPRVRMLVVPASRKVLMDAMDAGYIRQMIDAGAMVLNPGCGPCLGAHEGILAPGERVISTSNRNFKGRMGSTDSEIFLGSPQTIAASALAGEIVDPREADA